jgi:hypothetical protein
VLAAELTANYFRVIRAAVVDPSTSAGPISDLTVMPTNPLRVAEFVVEETETSVTPASVLR